jgi:ATP-dependent RNA helicase DeaD
MNFTDFNLKREIATAIDKAGFTEPSPIQKEAIPAVIEGRDVVAQAHTGTGKTAAFGLPILNNLQLNGEVEAIVIVPTRELAIQVSDELFRFGKGLGIKTATVYGGSSYRRQIQHIENAAIVVATPGRLLDLLQGKTTGEALNLSPSFVVLDEADEMLDMGFLNDIKEILSYLPSDRQTLLFSATMPPAIKDLAQRFLENPKTISITKERVTNDKISQSYYIVEEYERDDALVRLIDFKNPTKSIVFCRTKKEVDRLTNLLTSQGYSAKGLHGDVEQRDREGIIKGFRKSDIEILIATDVASRGLDVSDITHVFNYHIPFDGESYVHRIGRTGRAGREGVAVSIITPSEFRGLQRIEQTIGTKLETKVVPNIEKVKSVKMEQFVEKVETKDISEDATALVDMLEEKFDEKTLVLKLASIIAEDYQIKGSDVIGKSMADITRIIENTYRRGGRRDNRGGGRFGGRRDNRGGGRRDNRSGGGFNRNRRRDGERSGGGEYRERGDREYRGNREFRKDGNRSGRREKRY